MAATLVTRYSRLLQPYPEILLRFSGLTRKRQYIRENLAEKAEHIKIL